MGVAGSPVIGRRRGAFSTLLRRLGLWASSDSVLATKSKRKMLASTCLYSLYAWLNLCCSSSTVNSVVICYSVTHLLHFAWGLAMAKCILVTAVCVCLSLAAFPQYCMHPDATWGNDRVCSPVVHYWADLQSVHWFRCYDNIALNAKSQQGLVTCCMPGFAYCLFAVGLSVVTRVLVCIT